jgi:hypothetical protein
MLKELKICQITPCQFCQRNRYPVHCPMSKQPIEACKHYILARK